MSKNVAMHDDNR